MENDVARWRDTASAELQAAVAAAVRQLEADEAYEAGGLKTSETLRSLDDLAIVAQRMAVTLSRLSGVGSSALYEASRLQRTVIQLEGRLIGLIPALCRVEVDQAIKLAANIASCSESAKGFLVTEHMSDGPVEQGAGSSRGKESDLRAISYADGFESVPFRQPKDRFAVRIIEALVKTSHPAGAQKQRDSRARLNEFLDIVWSEAGRSPSPSWTRVIKSLGRIADKVRLDAERRDRAASRRARRNSSSPE